MPLAVIDYIARKILAIEACAIRPDGSDWKNCHIATVLQFVAGDAPSGSGIDHGTVLDLESSKPDRIRFIVAFHHMDDNGYYDGWTEHVVSVRPSLAFGFTVHISGRDRNGIKDYLHDVYHRWLGSTLPGAVEAEAIRSVGGR